MKAGQRRVLALNNYREMHFDHKISVLCCLGMLFWGMVAAQAQETATAIEALEKEQADLKAQQLKVADQLETLRLKKIREDLRQVGLPTVPADRDQALVEHSAMLLSYNEQHEQPNWVAHMVIPAVNEGTLTRTNDFRPDSLVATGTAVKADYWYSGYDRGHLAPSADFRWSRRAISESYFYSNMAPQRPELNRERWAELEGFLRRYIWATNEPLYIITGPIFEADMATITQGPNTVSIPKYFYKVVLDHTGDGHKAIAFILPNGTCSKPLVSYAVSIDEVERRTGLDFFPKLAAGEQTNLEAQNRFADWEATKPGEIGEQKPLATSERPKNTLNSLEAELFINKKACVCGTVVSTRKTNGGSIFFNFDAKFPNHTFSGSIWASNANNFSYDPEVEFLGKKLCITGKITDYKGKPTMNIDHEKRVTFLNEMGN